LREESRKLREESRELREESRSWEKKAEVERRKQRFRESVGRKLERKQVLTEDEPLAACILCVIWPACYPTISNGWNMSKFFNLEGIREVIRGTGGYLQYMYIALLR
jgi:hypothetical protein